MGLSRKLGPLSIGTSKKGMRNSNAIRSGLEEKYGGWSVNLRGFLNQTTVRTRDIVDLQLAGCPRDDRLPRGSRERRPSEWLPIPPPSIGSYRQPCPIFGTILDKFNALPVKP